MQEIEEFSRLFGNQIFRHKEMFFEELQSESDIECFSTTKDQNSPQCSHLAKTWRRRLQFMNKDGSIYKDSLALCEELEKTPEDICIFWNFKMWTSKNTYHFFINSRTNRILGTLFSNPRIILGE